MDDLGRRKQLTFEQAEGIAPLPRQLEFGEIDAALRASLWRLVHDHVEEDSQYSILTGENLIGPPWLSILRDEYVNHRNGWIDDFSPSFDIQRPVLKSLVGYGSYIDVFGFLQYVIRHPGCPLAFRTDITNALIQGRAAYRVIDDSTIVPIGSEEEAKTIEAALHSLSTAPLSGARTHLLAGARALTEGAWRDSIRESIHAVESVARVWDPTSNTLGPALKTLRAQGVHPSLAAGFEKIYGFTSDKQGIRHALIDDEGVSVDEADALFMFGACAAFVTYLILKARAAGVSV